MHTGLPSRCGLHIAAMQVTLGQMSNRSNDDPASVNGKDSSMRLPASDAKKQLPNLDGKRLVLPSESEPFGILFKPLKGIKKAVVPVGRNVRRVLAVPRTRRIQLRQSPVRQNDFELHERGPKPCFFRRVASASRNE